MLNKRVIKMLTNCQKNMIAAVVAQVKMCRKRTSLPQLKNIIRGGVEEDEIRITKQPVQTLLSSMQTLNLLFPRLNKTIWYQFKTQRTAATMARTSL